MYSSALQDRAKSLVTCVRDFREEILNICSICFFTFFSERGLQRNSIPRTTLANNLQECWLISPKIWKVHTTKPGRASSVSSTGMSSSSVSTRRPFGGGTWHGPTPRARIFGTTPLSAFPQTWSFCHSSSELTSTCSSTRPHSLHRSVTR